MILIMLLGGHTGYGDIAPQTGFERSYAVIAMAIGGVVFGLIIGRYETAPFL